VTTRSVDVVIVGSGAAGSLIAARLAQAGRQVLVLEAGPKRQLSDLVSSQIWARRIKWADPGIRTTGPDPQSVGFGSGWGTGGAALHHYGCWFRHHPEDFEMKSRFGKGLDWPISYEELRPWYDRVQAEVGLSGDAAREVWRPTGEPYPMPPLPVFNQGLVIARGFEKLGLRTAPLPLAINSVERDGRPACIFDGWCDAGCPTGALANPLAVYLPKAFEAGAEIAHDAAATRVLTNAKGDRATGVEWFDARGARQTTLARLVVVAAYAFETPRILLNSRPGGLANSSGTLGRYFMAHTTSNVNGLFHDETDNYMGVTGGQLVSQDAYAKDPAKGYVASSSWLIANALKPNDLLGIGNSRPELFGEALHAFLRTATQHLATMTFVGEGLPDPDNRLVLTSAKDANGFPLGRVFHRFPEDSIRCWEAGIARGKEIMSAAGAYEAWASRRAQMHTMGGAIMGRSPDGSVANGWGQTHDVPNLYIAGSSLFPTSGGVNPTFTLSALAMRSAARIAATWSDHA
jgi:choline dehydrogenase-like flavoprotein